MASTKGAGLREEGRLSKEEEAAAAAFQEEVEIELWCEEQTG
jgi:hypothetical protein